MTTLDPPYLWLALAMLIGGLELMLGTYYLLALAGGAVLTGLIAFLFPLSWWTDFAMFAILSIVSLMLMLYWRQTVGNQPPADDASRMKGRQVTVIQRVAPRGRVRHRGVEWNAESDEIFEEGDTAMIQDVRGSTLYISSKGGKAHE